MPERLSIVTRLARLPADGVLGVIWLYQQTFSPVLPVIFGASCGCRFSPSCSHYAAGAIRIHGLPKGMLLAVWRLVKCTPLHPGGFDPVPPRPTPSCVSVAKATPAQG